MDTPADGPTTTATNPAPADVAASIAAWAQTLEAVISLGETLTDDQWEAPTECPEWTVKDIYSHLVGGELWMAEGHPPPTEGLAAIAGRPVQERRDADPRSVLAELRDVFARRREQLAAEPPNPDEPAMTAFGARVTVGILLTHRAFDAWVHEQDIRRAVGVPGNLDTPSAHYAYAILTGALPRVVAKLAAAPPGSSVRLSVDGPVAFDHLITVDDGGRGRLHRDDHIGGDGRPATVELAMDWETFSRLTAGRISPASAAVVVAGDEELGGRILAHAAVTP